MEKIIGLIKFLAGSGKVEINHDYKIVSNFKDSIGKPNRFFTCGLKEKLSRRCSGDDIATKKYFYIDFDIRLNHYELHNGEILTQDQVNEQSEKIIKILEENGYGDYCAIIETGNGIHVYYAGEERYFEKEIYSKGVEYIFQQVDSLMWKIGQITDHACKDINRLSRLPGSINLRFKKHGEKILRDMGGIECQIRYFEEKNSELFGKIETFAQEQAKEEEHEKQEEKIVKEYVKKEQKGGDDIRKEINSIPARQLAEDIWGVKLGNTEKESVPLKEPHKNMGAYRYKPHNVIVNTNSSLISTKSKKTFTPYELVFYEMMNQDSKRTVEYFKDRYGIKSTPQRKTPGEIIIPKKEFKKQGYLYGNKTFEKFDCVMSGELMTVIAQSNSGKTSFAMDMIQTNAKKGKKGFYINLEFAIETMWQSRRLFLNGKRKRNLTDLEPLSELDNERMNKYVEEKLAQFEYHNSPNGMTLEDLVQLIIEKNEKGYGLFVIDTFSRISGNLDSKIAHTSQNKCMEVLQELCQSLGIVIVLLHHTNKAGVFEGTQKIMDMSNVFIMMEKSEDLDGNRTTTFELTKDKFQTKIEIETYYIDQEYSLVSPTVKNQPF